MVERRHSLIPLAALLLAGCAGMPVERGPAPAEPQGSVSPQARQETMRPATTSLIAQSRAERQAGNLDQAAATLERAIRIDPQQAALWLELAQVNYASADYGQAEQLARKARSLAAAGSAVSGDALRLIADALVRQGRVEEAQAVLAN